MRKLFKMVKGFFTIYTRKLWDYLVMSQYNRLTIAEYFRKKGVVIGENCSIMPRTLGNEPYLIRLGDRVNIAGGVVFVTHEGPARWYLGKQEPEIRVFGTIDIEDDVVIGQNVILMPNITIGRNTIVGAGSVVIKDIPPNSIAMGVPARVIAPIDAWKRKTLEAWQKQRLPDEIYRYENDLSWKNRKKHRRNREIIRRHLIEMLWKKDEEP